MEWLAVFLVLPSVVFAASCTNPKLTVLNVNLQNVSWAGEFVPSCLKGFEVCWSPASSNKTFCEVTTVNATSMLISNVQPCEHFKVHVTTIGKLNVNNSTIFGTDDADPKMKFVSVQLPNVSWTGAFQTLCLRGFQVCWSQMHATVTACEMVPPEATSLLINDVEPCAYINVNVTALGKSNVISSNSSNAGEAGPPKMSGLKSTQKSRDMTLFEWSSLSNYSCVENVMLWVCDNKTQRRNTCFTAKMYSKVAKLELYDFPVCRYYHIFACAQNLVACLLSSLRVYLDSANELTDAKATNISQDSAVVTWWVSEVNFTCKTEKLRLCYQEKNHESVPECWSWVMDQVDSSDSIALTNLYACASYSAVISLTTAVAYSYQTVMFTTPMMSDAIGAKALNVTDTAAVVSWSFEAERTDCRPDSMQICYSVVGSDVSGMCRSLGTATHSSVRLHNLAVCTSYDVSLTMLTTASPKPTTALKLTTLSKGYPVLESMITTAVADTVRVVWTPANTSLQCVNQYKVSWYSSGDSRKTWQTLSTGTNTFTIFAVTRGQTYYVEVAAVFVDGTQESLFQHVDVPAHSDSPTSFHTLSPLNALTVTIMVFLRYHHW